MGKLKDYIHDDRNLNKGTEFGKSLIERSFEKFGAGRSILVDRSGKIIAGNKSIEAAIKSGIVESIVVPTDGKKIVVVRRTDIDLDTQKGRELALADNASTIADIDFDLDELEKLEQDFGIDPKEWDMYVDKLESEDFNLDKDKTQQKEKETFTISIVFNNEYKDLINSYVRENGKEEITQKILELCQSAEVK